MIRWLARPGLLWSSKFMLGDWEVQVFWDVPRFAYRYWTKGRQFGLAIWAPTPRQMYDVMRDMDVPTVRLGPVWATKRVYV